MTAALRLDVLGGNVPAERLYAGQGFERRGTVRMFYADTGCTVMVMCPSMSLIATALFTGIDAEFFARFLATLYRNLPWALLWQIFAAGPATRGVFRAIFRRQLVENDRKAFSSDTECGKMDA